MAFKEMSANFKMPEVKRGRQLDPEAVKMAQAVIGGKVILATGDEKLTGKAREESARKEAAKVVNAVKRMNKEAQTAWSAKDNGVFIGLKAEKATAA